VSPRRASVVAHLISDDESGEDTPLPKKRVTPAMQTPGVVAHLISDDESADDTPLPKKRVAPARQTPGVVAHLISDDESADDTPLLKRTAAGSGPGRPGRSGRPRGAGTESGYSSSPLPNLRSLMKKRDEGTSSVKSKPGNRSYMISDDESADDKPLPRRFAGSTGKVAGKVLAPGSSTVRGRGRTRGKENKAGTSGYASADPATIHSKARKARKAAAAAYERAARGSVVGGIPGLKARRIDSGKDGGKSAAAAADAVASRHRNSDRDRDKKSRRSGGSSGREKDKDNKDMGKGRDKDRGGARDRDRDRDRDRGGREKGKGSRRHRGDRSSSGRRGRSTFDTLGDWGQVRGPAKMAMTLHGVLFLFGQYGVRALIALPVLMIAGFVLDDVRSLDGKSGGTAFNAVAVVKAGHLVFAATCPETSHFFMAAAYWFLLMAVACVAMRMAVERSDNRDIEQAACAVGVVIVAVEWGVGVVWPSMTAAAVSLLDVSANLFKSPGTREDGKEDSSNFSEKLMKMDALQARIDREDTMQRALDREQKGLPPEGLEGPEGTEEESLDTPITPSSPMFAPGSPSAAGLHV